MTPEARPPWSLIYGGALAAAVRARLESGRAPVLAEFYVSDRCALRCKHCFHGDVRSKEPGLSLEEWRRAIDEFVALGTRRLHFAGREPFLNPDLLPLLRWLKPRKQPEGLIAGAITDGFSCAPFARELADAGLDYLDVSVDGVRDDHDRLRGRGAYDRTLRALGSLLESLPGVCITAASVLTPDNAPHAAAFIEELNRHGVRRFYFQPVQPLGAARRMIGLAPPEFRATVLRVRDELESGRLAGRGLAVMFFFPVEHLPAAVAGEEWLEARLDEALRRGRASLAAGGNRLLLDFEIARAPFLNHAIVSHDGYLLARCASRSTQDYDILSPGNVRASGVRELLAKARGMALTAMAPKETQ